MTTSIPEGGFALPTTFENLPLGEVYKLLEPGPVVLLTTGDGGRANVMTMSWHMMVDFNPPLIACIVSDGDFSAAALRETGECVIALPAEALAEKVVAVGNCSGRSTDKFHDLGLTPLKGGSVKAPLVAECFANIECRVIDTTLVERFGLYVLQGVKAWRDPGQPKPKTIHHQGYGTFAVDGRTLRLKSRMP
jgi:flavin reductase (DIM6/NTAB) family NADH-FMN oxidoreductase RutF